MHIFALTALFLWKLFSLLSGHIPPQINSTNVINRVLGEKKSETPKPSPTPTPSRSPSPTPTPTAASTISTATTAKPTTLPTLNPSENFDNNSFDFTDTGDSFDIGTEEDFSNDLSNPENPNATTANGLKAVRSHKVVHKRSSTPTPTSSPEEVQTPSQNPSFTDLAIGFLRILFFPETLP